MKNETSIFDVTSECPSIHPSTLAVVLLNESLGNHFMQHHSFGTETLLPYFCSDRELTKHKNTEPQIPQEHN